MDLMRNWVHIDAEMVSVCVICAERTESVDRFLWNSSSCSKHRALFLEHLKQILGKEGKRLNANA